MNFIDKISLPEKSADSTDIRDFVFITNNPVSAEDRYTTLKNDPLLTGKTTLLVPATPPIYRILPIPHNLGYAPAFKVYYKSDDGAWHQDGVVADFASPAYFQGFAYADATNLYFQGTTDGSAFTFEIKYFIFRNNA